jgi:hypothetical protein
LFAFFVSNIYRNEWRLEARQKGSIISEMEKIPVALLGLHMNGSTLTMIALCRRHPGLEPGSAGARIYRLMGIRAPGVTPAQGRDDDGQGALTTGV